MTADHTLSQRLVDIRLEARMWILAVILTPLACAAGAAAWLYSRRDMPALWLDYQVARAFDFAEMREVSIPGWHTPSAILEIIPRHIPPTMLAEWDGDLGRLAAAAAVGVGVVAALLTLRALGFSLNRGEG